MDDGICAEVFLEPASSSYYLSQSPLVSLFKIFKKRADFGIFAKFAIARNCRHLWSRGLRQNIVPWLLFKHMLINRRWDLRRGVFGGYEFGLLFKPFSLGPPFEEFQKMADFGVFAKLAIARNCRHFWSRGCGRKLSNDCTLSAL